MSRALALLVAMLFLPPFGGCKQDRNFSLADVVSVSLSYPFSMDASVPVTRVTVQASGDAFCSKEDSSQTRWEGQLPASDSMIPDILSRPGVIHDLATSCSNGRSDTGPYLDSNFADGTAQDRLVDVGCTNDNLDALVQAMERIGDACIAAATVIPCRAPSPDYGPASVFEVLPEGTPRAIEDCPAACGSSAWPTAGAPNIDVALPYGTCTYVKPECWANATVPCPCGAGSGANHWFNCTCEGGAWICRILTQGTALCSDTCPADTGAPASLDGGVGDAPVSPDDLRP